MSESPVSRGVVSAVARAKGVSFDELRPLHDVVDPDALEALFADDGTTLRSGHVSFTYEGYLVQIREDGGISVAEAEHVESG